jgi:hypothetical protein
MAETCKTCRLVHGEVVSCAIAQALAMERLLDLIGDKAQCAACPATIYFVRHRNGKTVPYTPAGLNHFIDCPMREQFARKK